MKLLESAKDIKTSCYIYFFIRKKFNIITNMLRATKLVIGVTMNTVSQLDLKVCEIKDIYIFIYIIYMIS